MRASDALNTVYRVAACRRWERCAEAEQPGAVEESAPATPRLEVAPQPKDRKSPEGVAEGLRLIYARDSFAMRGPLYRISRRLFALADAAGIRDARRARCGRRHELYLTACERGFEQSDEAKALRREIFRALANILRMEELRRKVRGQEQEVCRPASNRLPRFPYTLVVDTDSLGNLGLVLGDCCPVYKAGDLKPGDAVAVERYGEDFSTCGRVVSADDSQITVRNDARTTSFDRSEVRIGRIDILNVSKDDPLSPEERKRVNQLRRQLEALDREDDQIIRCSRRYELEKEIFDLEHPVDVDDWSAWEGGDDEE